ncbi:RecQ family ATP-dependent DNA helicase, partial [Chloroflexota bacterium]
MDRAVPSQDVLVSLDLSPEAVADLPAKARTSLIAYLLRWEAFEPAKRCLQSLLETHSHLVTVHDSLARAHLGLGEPTLAVEVMRRRHELSISNSSQALLARAHLAAGDLEAARKIATMLVDGHPELLLTWSLQSLVCSAAGDYDGAERALEQRDALQAESRGAAHDRALLWRSRGDASKALLWARIAVERYERDGRTPPVGLLGLLEDLYRATEQSAQADATAARLARRHEREWAELEQQLSAKSASDPVHEPPPPPPGQGVTGAGASSFAGRGSVTGKVTLTPVEQSRLDRALHRDFPHDSFLLGQADVIAAVMQGKSVLAVMPTGAGKSLCYQLAALQLPGTTLVISPLIALMKDQLDGLPEGVRRRATLLNSTLEWSELEERLAGAARGRYKLVYAAPERLRQRPFLHCMARAKVSLLVVDEAHCVSLWGHDFRPDYLFIAKAWEELGQPPILAATATATARVRDDISSALRPMHLVATPVHRPNLRLEARRYGSQVESKRDLLRLCRKLEGSGIVYANTRKKCEDFAAMLQRRGVSAIHYHAGIDDRAAAQDRFMSGDVR